MCRRPLVPTLAILILLVFDLAMATQSVRAPVPAASAPHPVTLSVAAVHAIHAEERANRSLHRAVLNAQRLARIHAAKVAAAHARAVRAARLRAAQARAYAHQVAQWARSSFAWAHSAFALKVAQCESGGNAHNRGNPRYRGKWQMGYAEWADEGGTGDPADASEAEQDFRAWKLWKARGWSPWQCAGMV